MKMNDDLETLWSNLLGGDRDAVLAAWASLDPDEQAAVRAHLEAMASEDGWSEVQREAAQTALRLLDSLSEP